MGEESTGVMEPAAAIEERPSEASVRKEAEKEKEKESSPQEVSALRNEIEVIRDDLGEYISELDRRRHDALDLKLQFRKHKELVLSMGVGLVAVVGGLIAWRVRAARHRSFLERVGDNLTERFGDRFAERSRKSDVLGALTKAAIGIAAGAAATAVSTAVKGAVAKKVNAPAR